MSDKNEQMLLRNVCLFIYSNSQNLELNIQVLSRFKKLRLMNNINYKHNNLLTEKFKNFHFASNVHKMSQKIKQCVTFTINYRRKRRRAYLLFIIIENS